MTRGELLEDGIARSVAVSFVDASKTVQVNEDTAHFGPLPPVLLELLLEASEEVPPVVDPGRFIGDGHRFEPRPGRRELGPRQEEQEHGCGQQGQKSEDDDPFRAHVLAPFPARIMPGPHHKGYRAGASTTQYRFRGRRR